MTNKILKNKTDKIQLNEMLKITVGVLIPF